MDRQSSVESSSSKRATSASAGTTTTPKVAVDEALFSGTQQHTLATIRSASLATDSTSGVETTAAQGIVFCNNSNSVNKNGSLSFDNCKSIVVLNNVLYKKTNGKPQSKRMERKFPFHWIMSCRLHSVPPWEKANNGLTRTIRNL
uniref:Uncharacterized protein n=1 Tax=Romanomermis culicivorax TaxID=13658 RepID=A0A915JQK0_ROMCU